MCADRKSKTASPIRWVGGKTRLLPDIKAFLPEVPNRYFEPFMGGGALFIEYGHKSTGRAYLSDINMFLMNVYSALGDSVDDVLCALTNLGDTSYDNLRAQFNELKRDIENREGTDE